MMTTNRPELEPDVATQVAAAEARDHEIGPDGAVDRIQHDGTRGVVGSTDRPDRAR